MTWYGPWQTVGYPNSDFHAQILAHNNSFYETLQQSWVEQRDYAITYPLAALAPGHPLIPYIAAELASLKAVIPVVDTWRPLDVNERVTLGGWAEVLVNGSTGALAELSVKSINYAAPGQFGLLRYQTLTDDDYIAQWYGGAVDGAWWGGTFPAHTPPPFQGAAGICCQTRVATTSLASRAATRRLARSRLQPRPSCWPATSARTRRSWPCWSGSACRAT